MVGFLFHHNRVIGSRSCSVGNSSTLGGHDGGILALRGEAFALFLGQFFPLYLSAHLLSHRLGEVIECFLGDDAIFVLVFVPFPGYRPLQSGLEEESRGLHAGAIVDDGVVIHEFLRLLLGGELLLVVLGAVRILGSEEQLVGELGNHAHRRFGEIGLESAVIGDVGLVAFPLERHLHHAEIVKRIIVALWVVSLGHVGFRQLDAEIQLALRGVGGEEVAKQRLFHRRDVGHIPHIDIRGADPALTQRTSLIRVGGKEVVVAAACLPHIVEGIGHVAQVLYAVVEHDHRSLTLHEHLHLQRILEPHHLEGIPVAHLARIQKVELQLLKSEQQFVVVLAGNKHLAHQRVEFLQIVPHFLRLVAEQRRPVFEQALVLLLGQLLIEHLHALECYRDRMVVGFVGQVNNIRKRVGNGGRDTCRHG